MLSPLFGSLFILAIAAKLPDADWIRAQLSRPLPNSHVVGGDPASIFAAMNRHLEQQPHQTRACEDHSLDDLDQLARLFWGMRNTELARIYDKRKDKRGFHFDHEENSLAYKEALWSAERAKLALDPAQFGQDSTWYTMVRDGKCSEMVMWWVHHLTVDTQTKLARKEGFTVPLMPIDGDTALRQKALWRQKRQQQQQQEELEEDQQQEEQHSREYIYQVSCTDCHWNASNATSDHIPTPTTADTSPDAPPPGTCPIHPVTKKPSVWYEPMSDVGNRLKRCDWDYDPPCGLCEGIGGYAWGDAKDQISYVNCKPVALAKDIPKDNITTPMWPTSFVVYQPFITMINQLNYGGEFPGPDPCAVHVFRNDTELLHYDDSRTNYPGPILYMITDQTHFYQMPSADVFIKIEDTFCICVSPDELGGGIGPLVHDFAKDSVLIGREIIGLEGLNTSVEADHWSKGPHHFWISVSTNQFVRGWQPWNGLNVYQPGSWKIGPLPEEVFVPPKSCFDGPLHKNISCKAPYVPPTVE